MAKQRINWYRAKKEFLHNKNTSLKDVSAKYGISYSYIRKVSMFKGWGAEKKRFWKEVNKAVDKEIQRIITEKVKRDYKTTSLKQLNKIRDE